MDRRLPSFVYKTKICVICEGDEEFEYLSRLNELEVWDNHYELVLVNAGGNGNIPARYQDKYQNESDDIILVFCDTDRKPYEQYKDIKSKINDFHGVDKAADEVVLYGNPCTMDIIVKHWGDIDLKSSAKKVNSPIIEQYTGVKHYRAKHEQIIEIMKFITEENYVYMKDRVAKRSGNDNEKNSSNFDSFANNMEKHSNNWIDEINKVLEN